MTLNDRERRVCDLIRSREGALVEDLRLHVGLPTGGRNVAALDETRERLTARAAALGASVEIVPGVARPDWLYGEKAGQTPLPTAVCRRGAAGGREALIAGHLDTVHDPAGPFRALTIASDGKTATGPGCVDMKGGLVIGLAALEALEEAGERVAWTLLLNSDEETGSYHSAPAIAAEAKRVAENGGIGLALEPATADGGLVIERSGSAQFLVEVRGKAAHVGRDFASGASAVTALANVLASPLTENHAGSTFIINVGPLQGGTATNVVPDLARAWGNVRFAEGWQCKAFADNWHAVLKEPYMGTQGVFRISVGRPAKPETGPVAELAQLVRATSIDLGRPLPFSRTAGVCDGNNMQAAGLPTLDTLGVRGGGLHTPQEWIELSSLVERCQLLAVTMMRASRRD